MKKDYTGSNWEQSQHSLMSTAIEENESWLNGHLPIYKCGCKAKYGETFLSHYSQLKYAVLLFVVFAGSSLHDSCEKEQSLVHSIV